VIGKEQNGEMLMAFVKVTEDVEWSAELFRSNACVLAR
jgi:hypothetical protein